MKACPVCLGKYFDDMDICSNCGVKLIDHKIAKQIHDHGGAENYLDTYPEVVQSVIDYKKAQEKQYNSSSVTTSARSIPQKKQIVEETHIPKCPTCGSTNIRRISTAEKATSTIMFGIFSNKRKYQFECQNPKCKYKW